MQVIIGNLHSTNANSVLLCYFFHSNITIMQSHLLNIIIVKISVNTTINHPKRVSLTILFWLSLNLSTHAIYP